DRDQPAAQTGARLVAGVAVDEDVAAAHPVARTGVGAADTAPGGPAHDDLPSAHRRAGPVARVALDDDLAVGHPGPGVRPGVARDRQATAAHRGAEAADAPQVALDAHVVVAVAGDREQIADRRAAIAVEQREPLDLVPAETGEPVGRQRLGAHGCGGRLAQRERERHGTRSLRWKWCGPSRPP